MACIGLQRWSWVPNYWLTDLGEGEPFWKCILGLEKWSFSFPTVQYFTKLTILPQLTMLVRIAVVSPVLPLHMPQPLAHFLHFSMKPIIKVHSWLTYFKVTISLIWWNTYVTVTQKILTTDITCRNYILLPTCLPLLWCVFKVSWKRTWRDYTQCQTQATV